MHDIEHIRTRTGKRWASLRQEFIEAQNGLCAICNASLSEKHPVWDHCHDTGMVRGVLCTACNSMLGWYEARRQNIERYLSTASEFMAHRSKSQQLGPGDHRMPLTRRRFRVQHATNACARTVDTAADISALVSAE